jgi:hypothetical protein
MRAQGEEAKLAFIKKTFEAHGGIVRTRDLDFVRIYYGDLKKVIEAGLVKKIRYGYYRWIGNKSERESRPQSISQPAPMPASIPRRRLLIRKDRD